MVALKDAIYTLQNEPSARHHILSLKWQSATASLSPLADNSDTYTACRMACGHTDKPTEIALSRAR